MFSGSVKGSRVYTVFLLILLFWGRCFLLFSHLFAIHCCFMQQHFLHLNDTNILKALCHVLSIFSSSCPASILTSLKKEFLLDRELIRLKISSSFCRLFIFWVTLEGHMHIKQLKVYFSLQETTWAVEQVIRKKQHLLIILEPYQSENNLACPAS